MGRPLHRQDRSTVCNVLSTCQSNDLPQVLSMHAFNQSLKYDQRMHAADIRGSIAYAKSLTLVGILTKEEEEKIVAALSVVGKEWQEGKVRIPLFSKSGSAL